MRSWKNRRAKSTVTAGCRQLSTEEVRPGVILPFVHRPLGRYVNALADAGLVLSRMLEPAPPAGFLARADKYGEAATIPRLLVLLCQRSSDR